MAYVAFDTLKFVEKLISAGIPEPQAKAFSQAQQEALTESLDTTLATKLDIVHLDKKIDSDIARLDQKIDKVESRLEMKIGEVERKIDRLGAEFGGKFTLLNWMIGFLLLFVSGIAVKLFI